VPASSIEAEATGQDCVTAHYGGREWIIPLDVDTWPVEQLISCIAVKDKKALPNHGAVVDVLRKLLGAQWNDFITESARKRKQLVEASHVFAEAVGVTRNEKQPFDVAFGGIPRLLLNLHHWPGPIEATLHSLGYDYRDRWRFTAGRRNLTLRQIHNALTFEAPYDSPIAIAHNEGRLPLSDSAMVLMDIFEHGIGRGVPHPSRPLPAGEREKRKESAAGRERDAVADYRKRHKKNPLETAQANALALQQKEAHAS
jgi:hypothetical protein